MSSVCKINVQATSLHLASISMYHQIYFCSMTVIFPDLIYFSIRSLLDHMWPLHSHEILDDPHLKTFLRELTQIRKVLWSVFGWTDDPSAFTWTCIGSLALNRKEYFQVAKMHILSCAMTFMSKLGKLYNVVRDPQSSENPTSHYSHNSIPLSIPCTIFAQSCHFSVVWIPFFKMYCRPSSNSFPAKSFMRYWSLLTRHQIKIHFLIVNGGFTGTPLGVTLHILSQL